MTPAEDRPVWLSGPVLTALNKYVFPLAGCAAIVVGSTIVVAKGGLPTGLILLLLVVLAIVGMLTIGFASRVQNVGYRGRQLLVGDRDEPIRIPFEQIESVDAAWWYRGALVVIRFRGDTEAGSVVYYVPKDSAFRTYFSHPERTLREIIARPH